MTNRPEGQHQPRSGFLRGLLSLVVLVIAAIFSLWMAGFVSTAVLWYSTLGSLQNILHANIGLSEPLAGVLSPILAIGYLWAGWHAGRRLIPWKSDAKAVLGLIVFSAFLPAMHLFDAKFNRVTGAAQVCAFSRPDGTMKILSRGSNGACPYSQTGVKTVPITVDLECDRERQRLHVKPIPITGDPRKIDFINPLTGAPKVLYYKEMSGTYRLFRAGRYYSCGGDFLRPVTPGVRQAIIDQFVAEKARERKRAEAIAEQTRKAAEADAERRRKDAERRRKEQQAEIEKERQEAARLQRQRLVRIFDSTSYTARTVIVAVRAGDASQVSRQAAEGYREAVAKALQRRGDVSDEFRPDVFSSGYFYQIWNGQTDQLRESGISKKVRGVLLAGIDASCRPARSVAGLISCSVSATTHILRHGSSEFVSRSWTETAAGVSVGDALARAVELGTRRHPEIAKRL